VTARLTAALVLACLGLALGGGASATPPLALGPPATAHGLAVEIVAPDQTITASTPNRDAPPSVTVSPATFQYPDDGSIVSADSTFVTASASAVDGTAAVVTEVTNLSLFAGDIMADGVRASVSSAGTIGDLGDSTVTNLVVLGEPVTDLQPNTQLPLEDWGELTVLGESTKTGRAAAPFWRGAVTGLDVLLKLDHDGLPAGTEIRIAVADAYARPPASPATTTTTAKPARTSPAKARTATNPARALPGAVSGAGVRAADVHRPGKSSLFPLILTPPNVTPKLTASRYVFPVYGPSAYGDTFGAPRGDVSGGWHHGDDIFAPLGAPLLAVADGTVFSVGWNEVGGWRLWLRDRKGNEFYYAHLSAYSPLAVNGRRVKAGEVLGFVGNTGDAQGTPFHLHFEVHPVSLLFLGYDGAVDPTKYLAAWKRLEDIRILPAVPFGGPAAEVSSAPPAGAILLESTDISTANGLDPGSLTRAMNAPATSDVTKPRVAQLPVPLPVLDRA
jgi:murein DD-endopeptidase MepM/ murein hydrolase activator NlpD